MHQNLILFFCAWEGEEGRKRRTGVILSRSTRDGAGTSAESAWWRSAAKLLRRPETPGFAGPVDSVGFPKMEKASDPHQQASPGPEAASRGALPRLGDLSGLEAHPQDEEVVCWPPRAGAAETGLLAAGVRTDAVFTGDRVEMLRPDAASREPT